MIQNNSNKQLQKMINRLIINTCMYMINYLIIIFYIFYILLLIIYNQIQFFNHRS